ncbi:hypothetical protein CCACVL1_02002 [Corchorus capsularis]|uniref:Uncharacterized protein n=1 Tax=Corchorus capsularis TaxID=210143 RepID=A0A1R3KDU1_COCAP|nr:hypothetical protein CCACVL1_02002 [Corchorus capsularis]
MVMLSTSVLSIKWTIQGKPKSFLASIGGDVIIRVNSKFTLNQISGQVVEHEELWDLSSSSVNAQAFFWASRRLFATIEAGKDLADGAKDLSTRFPPKQENVEVYPDPSGDPTKFFQRDDGFQRDVYQIALFLAVVYFVVQFLRTTLLSMSIIVPKPNSNFGSNASGFRLKKKNQERSLYLVELADTAN